LSRFMHGLFFLLDFDFFSEVEGRLY